MSIYAFGANYNGNDMTDNFFEKNCVGIGWEKKDNEAGHNIVRSIKAGDIVYIKSCNFGSDIAVKAVGIVTDYEVKSISGVAEIARNVKWISKDEFSVQNQKDTDKNNVRSNSVYEEFNPVVISKVIDAVKISVVSCEKAD